MQQIVNFEQITLNTYKTLAATAAEYEFRIRLLANKTSDLRPYAIKVAKLSELEEKIFKKFGKQISNEDIEFLKRTRVIRNKIFHVDFPKLIKIMKEAGQSIHETAVTGVDFTTGEIYSEQQEQEDALLNFFKFVYGGGFQVILSDLAKANQIVQALTKSLDS